MGNEVWALCVLALVASVLAVWHQRKQERRATDDELAEWEALLIKGNADKPDKKPLVTTAELSETAYEAIEKLMHARLKSEYRERGRNLRNEMCARAVQLERVNRRQGKGDPLAAFDDAILIREKIRNGDSRDYPEDVSMEFTPGRKFDDEKLD